MKLYIATGHGIRPDGRYDPGAVGGGTTEQDAGDVIVQRIADNLADYDVEVVHEAYQDDPNYRGTIGRVNGKGYDGVLAIHHDWSGAPRGAFGHWYPDSWAKTWADACYAEVGAAGFPRRPSWHKARGELALLSDTDCPALLWECDRIGALSGNELVRMADALTLGTVQAFGLSERAPVAPDYDLDVAVIIDRDSPDDVAGRALGLEHVYAVRTADHHESIGYAIPVGGVDIDASRYPEGVLEFAGGDRNGTAELLIEATGNGPSRNRVNPTLDDLNRGQA